MKKLKTIWKNKWKILQGIYYSIIVKPEIESIAFERMEICLQCPLIDFTGKGCMVPGTQPCCNITKGGCGCKLHLKTRSLSSECPHPDGPKWKAKISQEEEDKLYDKIKYNPDHE